MKMPTMIKLELHRLDVGQILDGLEIRYEQYMNTAWYLEGRDHEMELVIADVSDADEARAIAQTYLNIINRIRDQWDAQKTKEA